MLPWLQRRWITTDNYTILFLFLVFFTFLIMGIIRVYQNPHVQFILHVTCGRIAQSSSDSDDSAVQYVMNFRFVDDVEFSYSGPYGNVATVALAAAALDKTGGEGRNL